METVSGLDRFSVLVENRIALRGLVKFSLSSGVPNETELHLISTLNGHLFEIVFEMADHDIFKHPLGLKLTVWKDSAIKPQVERLWASWPCEDWRNDLPVTVQSTFPGTNKFQHRNSESLRMFLIFAVFYGALIAHSHTHMDTAYQGMAETARTFYTTAAIRLGAFLRKREEKWYEVFRQLEPLGRLR